MKRRSFFRALGCAIAVGMAPLAMNQIKLGLPQQTHLYINGQFAALWDRMLSMAEIESIYDADQLYAPTNKALEFLPPQYVAVVSDTGDGALMGKIWHRGGFAWNRFRGSSRETVDRILQAWVPRNQPRNFPRSTLPAGSTNSQCPGGRVALPF